MVMKLTQTQLQHSSECRSSKQVNENRFFSEQHSLASVCWLAEIRVTRLTQEMAWLAGWEPDPDPTVDVQDPDPESKSKVKSKEGDVELQYLQSHFGVALLRHDSNVKFPSCRGD